LSIEYNIGVVGEDKVVEQPQQPQFHQSQMAVFRGNDFAWIYWKCKPIPFLVPYNEATGNPLSKDEGMKILNKFLDKKTSPYQFKPLCEATPQELSSWKDQEFPIFKFVEDYYLPTITTEFSNGWLPEKDLIIEQSIQDFKKVLEKIAIKAMHFMNQRLDVVERKFKSHNDQDFQSKEEALHSSRKRKQLPPVPSFNAPSNISEKPVIFSKAAAVVTGSRMISRLNSEAGEKLEVSKPVAKSTVVVQDEQKVKPFVLPPGWSKEINGGKSFYHHALSKISIWNIDKLSVSQKSKVAEADAIQLAEEEEQNEEQNKRLVEEENQQKKRTRKTSILGFPDGEQEEDEDFSSKKKAKKDECNWDKAWNNDWNTKNKESNDWNTEKKNDSKNNHSNDWNQQNYQAKSSSSQVQGELKLASHKRQELITFLVQFMRWESPKVFDKLRSSNINIPSPIHNQRGMVQASLGADRVYYKLEDIIAISVKVLNLENCRELVKAHLLEDDHILKYYDQFGNVSSVAMGQKRTK
jgi:hypothetical protein